MNEKARKPTRLDEDDDFYLAFGEALAVDIVVPRRSYWTALDDP